MALRTADEYREGLRDGREVYVRGQRGPDVTEHPGLRVAIDHGADVYDPAHEPETRELFTVELDGNLVNRFYEPLTSVETHTRSVRATLDLTEAVGTDALAGLALDVALPEVAQPTSPLPLP